MTDINEIKDQLNIEQKDMNRLPSMLNVLTILTYIGCAIGLLGGIYNYFTVCKSAQLIEGMGDNLDALSGSALGGMMGDAMSLVTKQCDNRLIILLVTLLGVGLCFYGAMQMRNLKKMGFNLYVAGELIVPIVMLILLGGGALGGFMLVGMIFPIIFVALYATQRKHLIY